MRQLVWPVKPAAAATSVGIHFYNSSILLMLLLLLLPVSADFDQPQCWLLAEAYIQ